MRNFAILIATAATAAAQCMKDLSAYDAGTKTFKQQQVYQQDNVIVCSDQGRVTAMSYDSADLDTMKASCGTCSQIPLNDPTLYEFVFLQGNDQVTAFKMKDGAGNISTVPDGADLSKGTPYALKPCWGLDMKVDDATGYMSSATVTPNLDIELCIPDWSYDFSTCTLIKHSDILPQERADWGAEETACEENKTVEECYNMFERLTFFGYNC